MNVHPPPSLVQRSPLALALPPFLSTLAHAYGWTVQIAPASPVGRTGIVFSGVRELYLQGTVDACGCLYGFDGVPPDATIYPREVITVDALVRVLQTGELP